jgi:hypothetical protein
MDMCGMFVCLGESVFVVAVSTESGDCSILHSRCACRPCSCSAGLD